jgi:hypothetical protein
MSSHDALDGLHSTRKRGRPMRHDFKRVWFWWGGTDVTRKWEMARAMASPRQRGRRVYEAVFPSAIAAARFMNCGDGE